MIPQQSPEDILKEYWGYGEFRPGQRNIIDSILAGNDTLALLPTGGGKSICFQVPGMLLPGLTLVISPLIALMKDQVDGLKKRGISAAFMNSGQSRGEIKNILENALQGHYSFLYISPERAISENFAGYIPNLRISFLVIDEAHCISMWGKDFRPSFQKIHTIRHLLPPKTPVAAFTASAPTWIQREIIEGLNMRNAQVHQGAFGRPNLNFKVIETENKRGLLIHALKNTQGCSIVFANTRKEVQELASLISGEGISAHYYHGGLPSQERSIKQQEWIQNRVRVMVCTNAFGMGVDKPDVRYVYHFTPSSTPEDYYQEAGRAGRDGKLSYCILFHHESDWIRASELIQSQHPPEEQLKRVYHALMNGIGVVPGQGQEQVFPAPWTQIADQYKIPHSEFYAALKTIEKLGEWELSEGMKTPSRFKFFAEYTEVYDFKIRYPQFEAILDVLLRSFSGVFDHYNSIVELNLSKKIRKSEVEVREQLKKLHKVGLIDYVEQTDAPMLLLMEPRSMYPSFNMKRVQQLKKMRTDSLNKLREFTQISSCRSDFWVEYFTSRPQGNCLNCDRCELLRKQVDHSWIVADLKKRVAPGISMKRLMDYFPFTYRREYGAVLNDLLDSGEIVKNQENRLTLPTS